MKNNNGTSPSIFSPNEYFWDLGDRKEELKQITRTAPSHENIDRAWDLAHRILSDLRHGQSGVACVADKISDLRDTDGELQSFIWQVNTLADTGSLGTPVFTQVPFLEIFRKYCDKYGSDIHSNKGIVPGFIQPMLQHHITDLFLPPGWESSEISVWEKEFFCSCNKGRILPQSLPPLAA